MSDCEDSYTLANYWLFQTTQWYTVIVLQPAIVALMYLIVGKMFFSTFHGNLKFVMIGYFASILARSIYQETTTIYILIHIKMAIVQCDVILEQTLLKYLHCLGIYTYTLPMIFPVMVSIERAFAIWKVERYENYKVLLGPILATISVFGNLFIVLYIYKDETFEQETVSFVIVPTSSALSAYTYFFVLFVSNIANFFFNYFLLKYSRKLNKKHTISLRARYQLDQVILSSKFCIIVITLNLSFFLSLISTLLSVIFYGAYVFPNSRTMLLFRCTMLTITPTSILLIGFISIHYYNKIKAAQINRLRRHVEMESRATHVAEEHFKAIQSSWNVKTFKK